jgi:CheY-like chemotaxis protein
VHVTEVALPGIREFAERTFGPLAAEKGLGLDVEIAPDLPELVVTDEVRLQQVLKNLLSNALKFTEKGGVVLRVGTAPEEVQFATPELANAASVIAFSVSDTGIGIPGDKLNVIFEAFQQADGTTSRRYGGTGLGLNISREIASLLGGEIRVRSQLGRGSTFTLYLPALYTPPKHLSALEANLERLVDEGRELLEASETTTLDPALLLPGDVEDDRNDIEDGDRVLLLVEEDADLARAMLDAARERGFKTVVARRGDAGLALAHELRPSGIVLDTSLPAMDGWTVLDELKHSPVTRHIPVHMVSANDGKTNALRAGALAVVEKPLDGEHLAATFERMERFIDRGVKSLLVVEDDDDQRTSIVELISDDDVEITAVASCDEARELLRARDFDCMVLDLKLSDGTGFELLEQMDGNERLATLPVIVYTGADLSPSEEARLNRFAEAIVVKDARSPERLLDETALFLHRAERPRRRPSEQGASNENVFRGKKVLIVDDDVRNVFALTSALEAAGMDVIFAENGQAGIDTLNANPDVDVVLMDIMMPELDGYEAMREIRKVPDFARLPIISLTAKAMKGDRDRSIEAGASDYITKPVDTDQLLSLMRVWLYR